MSVLNDNLSIWEIGFRWAGYDPDQIRFRLPLPVRDNFRVLMDAILCDHLYCMTLGSEKYQGNDPEEAQLYIRHWLDDVYDCIEGQTYSKKMLKWARVERSAFQQWCERRNIPLPEFWFPPGWALEYNWEEETLVDTAPSPESGPFSKSGTNVSAAGGQADRTPADPPENIAESGPFSEDRSIDPESSEKLREYQRRAIAVQVVAKNLWKTNPELTITSLMKNEVILDLCGGRHQAEEVLRRWIRGVAPEEVKKRRGRPRKKKGTDDA